MVQLIAFVNKLFSISNLVKYYRSWIWPISSLLDNQKVPITNLAERKKAINIIFICSISQPNWHSTIKISSSLSLTHTDTLSLSLFLFLSLSLPSQPKMWSSNHSAALKWPHTNEIPHTSVIIERGITNEEGSVCVCVCVCACACVCVCVCVFKREREREKHVGECFKLLIYQFTINIFYYYCNFGWQGL